MPTRTFAAHITAILDPQAPSVQLPAPPRDAGGGRAPTLIGINSLPIVPIAFGAIQRHPAPMPAPEEQELEDSGEEGEQQQNRLGDTASTAERRQQLLVHMEELGASLAESVTTAPGLTAAERNTMLALLRLGSIKAVALEGRYSASAVGKLIRSARAKLSDPDASEASRATLANLERLLELRQTLRGRAHEGRIDRQRSPGASAAEEDILLGSAAKVLTDSANAVVRVTARAERLSSELIARPLAENGEG